MQLGGLGERDIGRTPGRNQFLRILVSNEYAIFLYLLLLPCQCVGLLYRKYIKIKMLG